MKILRAPPPKLFSFRCETCGEYPVTEQTMREFLTEKLRKKLDEALQKGAHGARLTFETGCPVCTPDNPDAVVELAALWPKVH